MVEGAALEMRYAGNGIRGSNPLTSVSTERLLLKIKNKHMTKFQKFSLFILRVTTGWMFFYAGITKVLNPQWSAEGYIKGAKSFTWFFQVILNPDVLPIINFMNKWGLLLLGVSLILGLFVRISSLLGILLMALYYIALGFPYPNPHSYIVDEHIIYIGILLFFATIKAGRYGGLDSKRVNHHSGIGRFLG